MGQRRCSGRTKRRKTPRPKRCGSSARRRAPCPPAAVSAGRRASRAPSAGPRQRRAPPVAAAAEATATAAAPSSGCTTPSSAAAPTTARKFRVSWSGEAPPHLLPPSGRRSHVAPPTRARPACSQASAPASGWGGTCAPEPRLGRERPLCGLPKPQSRASAPGSGSAARVVEPPPSNETSGASVGQRPDQLSCSCGGLGEVTWLLRGPVSTRK